MSILSVDGIENTIRSEEFMFRVTKAANDHLRLTEPTWDLHDVKMKTETGFLGEKKVAVTLLFKDNGLGIV